MNSPGSATLQERSRLHPILEGIWMWSVFSEEKGLFFNGYVVRSIYGLVIVDPPSAGEAIFAMIESLGATKLIVLTNRDHERESAAFQARFNVPVACHEADAPLLATPPGMTYTDTEVLCGDFEAIHLPHQKSPGETAFYLEFQKALLLGDALLGKTELMMLPDDKYADKALARQGLQKLAEVNQPIEAILVGDGEPILTDGQAALDQFLSVPTP